MKKLALMLAVLLALSCTRKGSAPVSLRLGHDTALTATGSHSLPCRRFATPASPF